MNIELNYESLHRYLLSLYTVLLVMGVIFTLSPTDTINSKYVNLIIVYSLFGLICCVLAWNKIDIIINNAKSVRFDGLYNPSFDDSTIHKILSERLQVIDNLIKALLIGLAITILLFI